MLLGSARPPLWQLRLFSYANQVEKSHHQFFSIFYDKLFA